MTQYLFFHTLSMCKPKILIFSQKNIKIIGLSFLQIMITAMTMLTYRITADSVNDYVRMVKALQ